MEYWRIVACTLKNTRESSVPLKSTGLEHNFASGHIIRGRGHSVERNEILNKIGGIKESRKIKVLVMVDDQRGLVFRC